MRHLRLDGRGNVYGCDAGRKSVVRFAPNGEISDYCSSVAGRPLEAPNWAVFALDGSLIVSDSGPDDPDMVAGQPIIIPPGGGDATMLLDELLACPNGLALSRGGDLFVAESFRSRVLRVRKGRIETYVELPDVIPDGLALDVEGGLLVACFQPNRLLRVRPGASRAVDIVLDDPSGLRLLTPTNVAFFGPELSSLAIAQLGGHSVLGMDMPWKGQPLIYPLID